MLEIQTVGPPDSGKLNVRWDGKGMEMRQKNPTAACRFLGQSSGAPDFPFTLDFVIGCQNKWEAEKILAELKERLRKFGLEVSEEKTRIVEFGRYAKERAERREGKAGTVDFLGFTHFCAEGRNGMFVVGRRTSGKKFRAALMAMKEWLKRVRNRIPLEERWKILGWKLQGHYQYYGITGNGRSIYQFYRRVLWLAYKGWNRRSQQRSGGQNAFARMVGRHPLPLPRIAHSFRVAAT